MAESTIFSELCDALQEATSLDRLESRGTARIAIKQAGLIVASLTREQALVLLDKVLPAELAALPRRLCQPRQGSSLRRCLQPAQSR
jgi:hypothetical protein